MRLKLALLTVACFAAICASATAAGGPVILGGNYGTSAARSADGEFSYSTIYVHEETILEKIALDNGRVASYRTLDPSWSLPAVTVGYEAGGLSTDGSTLTLVKRDHGTHLMVLSTRHLQTRSIIHLDGTFSFDALSPDGRTAYLVQYPDPRDPFNYRVRAYDLAHERFIGGAIVDQDEPDEKMTGRPVSRVYSPDGTWAYTLYGGGEETFIHALDTVHGRAECIDLDMFGPKYNYFTLALSIDDATGAIVVRDRRLNGIRPAAIVDPTTHAVIDTPDQVVADAMARGVVTA
jgi:hypothetical protein